MRKIIHSININMENLTYKVHPPIDIYQGDLNTHVLLFQLYDKDGRFTSIDPTYNIKLSFYDSREDLIIESDDVVIENQCRGQISYVVDSRITRSFGRYTSYLKIYSSSEELFSLPFIVTVVKSHDYSPRSREVVLTEMYRKSLDDHLNNESNHLSETDRDFLDTFNDEIDKLITLLDKDLSVDSEIVEFSSRPVENRVVFRAIKDLREYIDERIDDLRNEITVSTG